MDSSGEELGHLAGLSDDDFSDLEGVSTDTPARKKLLTGHLLTNVEWSQLHLSKPLLRAIADLGFARPTPIQAEAIPAALEGHDVFGMAETGSGKTYAFLLPVLERLLQSALVRQRRLDARTGKILGMKGRGLTKVLVLLPTRELAIQCYQNCCDLCKYAPITRCLLYGGIPVKEQEITMRVGPDIVVATPGRCLDMLLNAQSVHMNLLDIVVFDEADKLVDMGFQAVCTSVLEHCSQDRQTLLFSATLSAQAKELVRLSLREPVRIPRESTKSTAAMCVARNVQNFFIKINQNDQRLATLFFILKKELHRHPDIRVIVFFNTRNAAHKAYLTAKAVSDFMVLPAAGELHGNLSQTARNEMLEKFKRGKVNILFATELVARGLDAANVNLVINAELPADAAKFVHRVGRTARAGTEGRAITIYNVTEEKEALKLIARHARIDQKLLSEARILKPEDLEQADKVIRKVLPLVSSELTTEQQEREIRKLEQRAERDLVLIENEDVIHETPFRQWIPNAGKKRKAPPTSSIEMPGSKRTKGDDNDHSDKQSKKGHGQRRTGGKGSDKGKVGGKTRIGGRGSDKGGKARAHAGKRK